MNMQILDDEFDHFDLANYHVMALWKGCVIFIRFDLVLIIMRIT